MLGTVGVPRTPNPAPIPDIGAGPRGSRSEIVISMGAGANSGSLANNAFVTNVPAAVGDFVLVSFSWAIASQTINTCTDTQGNTWTIVNHPAASSQSGGYCYTTVTVGWASTNTVTATLSSTGGGREVAGAKILAAYSPVVDQHNEGTASGDVVATLSGSLAQDAEVIIISDIVRATGASTIPVWQWNRNFQPVASSGGSGTLDAGVAIGAYDNLAGTAPITGGFQSATTTDVHGWGILAVKVTYPVGSSNQTIAPPVATASASSPVSLVDIEMPPPVATASASAPVPTITVNLAPPATTAAASSPVAALNVNVLPPASTASASAPVPTILSGFVLSPPAATASASAPVPTITVGVPPPTGTASASSPIATIKVAAALPLATASASGPIPGLNVNILPPAATAAASAPTPTVTGSQVINAPVATASASAPVPTILVKLAPPAAAASASAPLPGQVGNRIQVVLLATLASASASAPIPLVTTGGTATTLTTAVLTGYITVGSSGTPSVGDSGHPSVGDTGQPLTGSTGPVRVGR